jgi:hypothetical protein
VDHILQDGQRRKRTDWKKQVMPAIKDRLQDFKSRGMNPTLRAMFYALVSLEVMPNNQGKYQYLSEFTARARENGELPKTALQTEVEELYRILTTSMNLQGSTLVEL